MTPATVAEFSLFNIVPAVAFSTDMSQYKSGCKSRRNLGLTPPPPQFHYKGKNSAVQCMKISNLD